MYSRIYNLKKNFHKDIVLRRSIKEIKKRKSFLNENINFLLPFGTTLWYYFYFHLQLLILRFYHTTLISYDYWLFWKLELKTCDILMFVTPPLTNFYLGLLIRLLSQLTNSKKRKQSEIVSLQLIAGCFEVACTVKSIKIKFEKYSRKLHYSRRGEFCSNRPPILQALKSHHLFLFGYNV